MVYDLSYFQHQNQFIQDQTYYIYTKMVFPILNHLFFIHLNSKFFLIVLAIISNDPLKIQFYHRSMTS